MPAMIPIHDFSKDDRDSVPFRFIPLNAGSEYDTREPHRHNYYEIFFFDQGGGTHTIDFEAIPIQEKSIHFVSPGQVHLLKREKNAFGHIILFSRDFYHMTIAGSSLHDFPFLNNSYVQAVLNLSDADHAQFTALLGILDNEVKQNKDTNKVILGHYLQIILLKCMDLFKGKTSIHAEKSGNTFQKIRALVEEHYRRERQPTFFASQLNMTEKKLNETCKEFTGASISDFIKSRVLLEAKRLLVNSEYSIKEIAFFLGFEDPSYFNRFFRVNTGLTAGDFRKGVE
jgi:AraC family transcriptional activator of pobA